MESQLAHKYNVKVLRIQKKLAELIHRSALDREYDVRDMLQDAMREIQYVQKMFESVSKGKSQPREWHKPTRFGG